MLLQTLPVQLGGDGGARGQTRAQSETREARHADVRKPVRTVELELVGRVDEVIELGAHHAVDQAWAAHLRARAALWFQRERCVVVRRGCVI
jgi:hypothetical protein